MALKKAWLMSLAGDDSDWEKKVAEVEVAAIPQMLALADQEMPKMMRSALRHQLLEVGGCGCVGGAGLRPSAGRHTGARVVHECGGGRLGETDPAGVVAWMEKLPSGLSAARFSGPS